MKKLLLLALVALLPMQRLSAQFEQGKAYVGASLTGLNLSYNGSDKTSLGLEAKGGWLFSDDLMLTAECAYSKKEDTAANLSLGVGGRYYIVQNGLFLGARVMYSHQAHSHDDFMPGVSLGYAFFISHTVTIEPEIYYNQSFKNHKDYSTIGLRIGLGVYL